MLGDVMRVNFGLVCVQCGVGLCSSSKRVFVHFVLFPLPPLIPHVYPCFTAVLFHRLHTNLRSLQ